MPTAKLRLIVQTPGKWQGRIITIDHFPFVIGRDQGCQLRPASAMVSNRHCALIANGGRIYLRDLASTNGTHLNAQPLNGEQELRQGDSFRVGPLVFDVAIDERVGINQPTPLPKSRSTRQPDMDDIARVLEAITAEPESKKVPMLDADQIPAGGTALDLLAPPPAEPAPRPNHYVQWEDIGNTIELHFTEKRMVDEKKTRVAAEQLAYLAELSGRRNLLLNLGNVQAMSSAMIDHIVAFHKKVRSLHGKLVLCNLQADVAPVIHHLKLNQVLTIRKDAQEGHEAFRT
jgi:anti-anti-sigma factor